MQQAKVGDYLLLQIGIAGLGTVYLAKKNQNTNECSICKGIIINGENRKEICKTLEALAAKAGLRYKTIIENRLCKSTLSNLRLAEVATKLTSYSAAEIQVFLNDINCQNNISNAPNNGRSICNFVTSLRISIIDAWKICKDARPNSAGLRLDWDILESVAHYQTSSSIKDKLTLSGTDYFLKMLLSDTKYVGTCNTCALSTSPACGRLPYLHVYLNALKSFAIKYDDKTGFANFIKGEAASSSNTKHDGAYHLMRHLNGTGVSASSVLSFEQTIKSKMTTFTGTFICDCVYDVERSNDVLVDYKSFGCDTDISNTNQFKQYLQYWSDTQTPIKQFEYIFNSDKLTLEEAKKKFVTLLKADPAGYYNVNPAFFNRITGVTNAIQFETELVKPNFWQNDIFTFVTIVP
jgi:hypothetical protein